MKRIKAILLYPFALLYGVGVRWRNFLFAAGIFKSHEFNLPVIAVGNITVGGTGKTPTVEHLLRLLPKDLKVAVLSRGYGRKTHGFLLADEKANSTTIGDEPMQIKEKFPEILVAVDEKRKRGIENLIQKYPEIDLILLDDAFQHRSVKAGMSILLIDYTQPFLNDHYLPLGRLREHPAGRYRAEIIIITKTPPDIRPIDMRLIATDLKMKPYQVLFFSSIDYDLPAPVFPSSGDTQEKFAWHQTSALLVAGIGNPQPFFSHCQKLFAHTEEMKFRDHKRYRAGDLKQIAAKFHKISESRKIILTTEKDATKWREMDVPESLKKHLYYLPIKMKMLNDQENDLQKYLSDYLKSADGDFRFIGSKKKY